MQGSGRRTRAVFGATAAGIVLAASAAAHAGDERGLDGDVEALRQRVEAQNRQIEALQRDLMRQQAALQEMREALGIGAISGRGPAAPSSATAAPATSTSTAPSAAAPAASSAPAAVAAAPSPAAPPARAASLSASPTAPTQVAQGPSPVGQAPARSDDNRPPPVAPIFEQPGVLTPRGRWVVEPSLQYAYSSSNRVALVGYTIIPALLIGLIDVREVKSDSFIAALTVRRGITNRLELEAKVPFVYRSDSTVSREVIQGASRDSVFDADGRGLGDIELTARYQLNDGGADRPYYVGSLRFKSRTGKDPFEVETNETIDGAGSTGLQTELPTGSGFYTLQPGLTVLVPSDPAVFFGGVSYQYSFERSNLSRKIDSPPGKKPVGDVRPGGAIGFNFGMGLALNERSSFSIGYDHLSVGKIKINGRTPTTAVRVQLGTLLLGYSYRLDANRTLNLSLGAGLTRDTPDLQLNLRMPVTL